MDRRQQPGPVAGRATGPDEERGRGDVEWPREPELAWRDATCDPMDDTNPVPVDGTVYVAHNNRPGTRVLPLNAAPAAADGTVFVPGGIGSASLYALDASDGSVRWRTDIGGDGLSETPAVGPEAVCVADSTRRLLAVDRATGAVRWTVDDFESPVRTPAIAGDRLHVGTRDHSVRSRSTARRCGNRATSGSIAVDDRRVYTSAGNTPTALGADSGDAVWNAGVGERTSHAGPLVVAETTVYVGRLGERTDDGPRGTASAFKKRSGDQQ